MESKLECEARGDALIVGGMERGRRESQKRKRRAKFRRSESLNL